MKDYYLNILWLSLILLFGCVNPFAPSLSDEIFSSDYMLTDQTSPEKVLINFKYAYTFKDSLIYSELIDSSYVFRSWDYSTTPATPVEWNRDEELKITGRLFRYFNTIDLVWNATTYTDTLAENMIEMRKSFTLLLNGGVEIPVVTGEVLFRFILKQNNKWYINYWEDLKI